MDRWLAILMLGARRHARAVFLSTIALSAAGALLVSRVSFDANILRLLPQHTPSVQSFRIFLEAFGSLDHLYIVFESADAIGEHKDVVDAYVSALGADPLIESVDSQLFEPGRDWSYLSDRVLFLLGPFGAADALQRFHPPRLDAEITHARDLLSSPSADVKAYVQQDPTGLFAALRTRLERQKGGLAFDPTQEGYVSRDGRSRLLVVKPRGEPFDVAFCRRLFARLEEAERTARAAIHADGGDASGVRIQAAGAYRVSLEAERLIRREGVTNGVVALALLLVIVIAVFRTPWILLLGIIPLLLAALLSLGLNGVLRGALSPATSGSAGMLFGLAIDGVVLLYVRYLEERHAAGRSAVEATRAMAGTASSVVLAQSTTVATFFALLLLDFPTLNDLGGLVGLGILLVCPLTLVLLPALLTAAERAPRRPSSSAGQIPRRGPRLPQAAWLGRLVVRRSRVFAGAGVLLTIALGLASTSLTLDTRIERLQAATEGAALEREVAERFGLPRDVLIALNHREHLEPLIEADRRLGERIASVDPTIVVSGIGSVLPPASSQGQVARVLRDSGDRPDAIERDIEAAAARAGFRAGAFAPFFDRLPRLLDPDRRITYGGLIEHGLGPIVSRFVVEREGGYTAATYLYPQRPVDVAAVEAALHRADPRFELTGLTVVNRDLGGRFLPEFLKGVGVGTIGVALLMYLVFRRVRLTLLALVPTVIGFVWSAGLLALFRVNLDLFSLLAAVTFIGIAVDYGIYVLYRHAVEGEPVDQVLARTGAAIGIACATALIGFGTLVFSTYPPLRTFGVMSIVTLTCCLAAALLFLPALLVKPSPWSRPAR